MAKIHHTPPHSSPVEDVTRRQVLASAFAAALLLACSEDDDTPSAEATRTFRDSTGASVQVPVRPSRIVAPAAPHWAAAQILSLGFPVLGMSSWEEGWPPAYMSNYFSMDGIKGLGWNEETDIEAIIALEPDLIVCSATAGVNDLAPAVLERLWAIAPVVAIDPKRQIEEVMNDYVELLGADPSILSTQKHEFEAVMDQIKALLGDGWKHVTVANLWPGADYLEAWGPDDLAMNAIISRLGVSWTPLVLEAGKGDGFIDVSLERMAEFEADLLLYGNVYNDVAGQPLYENLKVVQAKQVIPFPDFTFDGTHYPNYIACAQYLLRHLQEIQPLRTDIVS